MASSAAVERVRAALARGAWTRLANKEDVVVAFFAHRLSSRVAPVAWQQEAYHEVDGEVQVVSRVDALGRRGHGRVDARTDFHARREDHVVELPKRRH